MANMSCEKVSITKSLRARIIATTILPVLVAFVVIIVGNYLLHRKELIASASAQLQISANQLRDLVDETMFERTIDCKIVTQLPLFTQTNSSRSDQRILMTSLTSSFSEQSWIGLTDLTGIVLVSSNGLLEGKSVAQRDWWVHGFNQLFIGDVHAATLLAGYLGKPTDSEPLRFVDIALPVFHPNGTKTGVLGYHLGTKWLKDLQQVARNKIDANVEYFVVSSTGFVWLGPANYYDPVTPIKLDHPCIRSAREGKFTCEDKWENDEMYISGSAISIGYRDFPGLDWVFIARKKTSLIERTITETEGAYGGFAVGVVFILSFLLWFLMSSVTKPILKISLAASKILSGDRSPVLPHVSQKRQDEVAVLFNSIGGLISALDSESCLRLENEQLEKKVSERTAELAAKCLELEKANNVKNQFLSTISHELRTPLNAIMTANECISQGCETSEEHDEMLSVVQESGARMLLLVNNLLDFQRLQTGRLPLVIAKHNVRDLVEDCVAMFGSLACMRFLELAYFIPYDFPKILFCDATRFKQVLSNLISNGIKFTPSGFVHISLSWEPKAVLFSPLTSPIHQQIFPKKMSTSRLAKLSRRMSGLFHTPIVSISSVIERTATPATHTSSGYSTPAEKEPNDAFDGTVIVTVKDSGIGMSPEFMRNQLFHSFTQANSNHNRAAEGNGLGLALSQILSQLMGGDIVVQSSSQGTGSIFTFTMPARLDDEMPAPGEKISPNPNINQIFLVGFSDISQKLLKQMCSGLSFHSFLEWSFEFLNCLEITSESSQTGIAQIWLDASQILPPLSSPELSVSKIPEFTCFVLICTNDSQSSAWVTYLSNFPDKNFKILTQKKPLTTKIIGKMLQLQDSHEGSRSTSASPELLMKIQTGGAPQQQESDQNLALHETFSKKQLFENRFQLLKSRDTAEQSISSEMTVLMSQQQNDLPKPASTFSLPIGSAVGSVDFTTTLSSPTSQSIDHTLPPPLPPTPPPNFSLNMSNARLAPPIVTSSNSEFFEIPSFDPSFCFPAIPLPPSTPRSSPSFRFKKLSPSSTKSAVTEDHANSSPDQKPASENILDSDQQNLLPSLSPSSKNIERISSVESEHCRRESSPAAENTFASTEKSQNVECENVEAATKQNQKSENDLNSPPQLSSPKIENKDVGSGGSFSLQEDCERQQSILDGSSLSLADPCHRGSGQTEGDSHEAGASTLEILATKENEQSVENPVVTKKDFRILVAEDNKINQKVLLNLLKRFGYTNVAVANDGLEALTHCQKQKFHVILMDVQMPIMDGIEATLCIRKLYQTNEIQPKIVAITANVLEHDKQRCLDASMDEFMSKPIDSKALEALLQSYLNTAVPIN